MLNALNVRNQTPLMIAVQTGKEEIVRAMVDFIGDEVHMAATIHSCDSSSLQGTQSVIKNTQKRAASFQTVEIETCS